MLKEGLVKNTNITLKIVEDKHAVHTHFARTMADIIKTNNQKGRPTNFIMPVGPTGQYKIFADICAAEKISLASVHFFNMDEYVGNDGANLPDDHPLSFACFLRENFFKIVDPACKLNRSQMHIPDAKNPAAYSKMIAEVGGIDACFGGIGINGHMAFNEALDYWELMSNDDFKKLSVRVIKIAATTKVINAVFGTGGNLQAVPNFAVTVGMKEILESKKIYMYLDWFWQTQVLRNTLFGPVTPMFPGSFLQQHPDVTLVAAKYVAQEPQLMPE